MSRDKDALLRQRYTGEPYSQALYWIQHNGLFDGVVPDADDPAQTLLEAAALMTLARRSDSPLPLPHVPSTFLGLDGVTSNVGDVILRPASELTGVFLARLLPTLTAEGTVAGVPGLRAFLPRRGSGQLALRRLGGRAEMAVQASHRSQAAPNRDLEHADVLARDAGLTPLWTLDHQHSAEAAAWHDLTEALAGDEHLWSMALRRAGLFLGEHGPWQERPPTADEVAGPRPDRLTPRPVAATKTPRGVVAVTSANGRGGYGCTTAVVALAGALARSGVKVIVLAGDDPMSVFATMRMQPPQAGTWIEVPGGTLRNSIMLGSLTPESATAQVRAARAQFEMVLIDAGNVYQHRETADLADVTVLLTQYQEDQWGYTERIDRRPEDIQFFDWMDREAAAYFEGPARVTGERQRLLNLLTTELAWYLAARTVDPAASPDDALPYDADDPQDADAWWTDAWDDSRTVDTGALHDELGDATKEDLIPHQEELASFLAVDGRHRHGAAWASAVDQWLAMGAPEVVAELTSWQPSEQGFMEHVEKAAVERWGSRVWQDKREVWAIAREAGDDLVTTWADRIEDRYRPLPAADTAQALMAAQLQPVGTRRLIALSGVQGQFPFQHLAEVGKELPAQFSGVAVWPRNAELQRLLRAPELLARRAGPGAVAANRLAQTVVRLLG